MTHYNGSHKFGFTVSHTTRSPRLGEVCGVHYHFCNADEIQRAIDNQEFLEYAHVHGNTYGTSLESLKKVQCEEGKLPLLDIDVQGVKHIKDYIASTSSSTPSTESTTSLTLDAKYIFIAPPSFETLQSRLEGRGTESAESLAKRTKNAKAEMEYGLAPGNFDVVIVNDDLDQACLDFDKAVAELYAEE